MSGDATAGSSGRVERLLAAAVHPCASHRRRHGYGYELHHWLLRIGLECDLGTVYRSLNTMEAEGLLRSSWERTPEDAVGVATSLSESGLDMVDAFVAPVEQLRSVAQEFLDMRKAGGTARLRRSRHRRESAQCRRRRHCSTRTGACREWSGTVVDIRAARISAENTD